MISTIFGIMLLSIVNGLVHMPSHCLQSHRLIDGLSLHQSPSQLNAEKSESLDRSASVCVSDFFSNNGKSLKPVVISQLAAVRVAGVEALSTSKLPFGKDEAWR